MTGWNGKDNHRVLLHLNPSSHVMNYTWPLCKSMAIEVWTLVNVLFLPYQLTRPNPSELLRADETRLIYHIWQEEIAHSKDPTMRHMESLEEAGLSSAAYPLGKSLFYLYASVPSFMPRQCRCLNPSLQCWGNHMRE